MLLSNCGKTPEAWPALAAEHRTGPTVTATSILMYTRNGPVNDPAWVDRFLLSR